MSLDLSSSLFVNQAGSSLNQRLGLNQHGQQCKLAEGNMLKEYKGMVKRNKKISGGMWTEMKATITTM